MKNLSIMLVLVFVVACLGGCQGAAPATQVPQAEPTAVPQVEPTAVPQAEPTAVPQEQPTEAAVEQPTKAAAEGPKDIVLVTGLGGLGDMSFNDVAWTGTQIAAEEYGLTANVVEPKSMAELEAIHRENAKSGKYVVDIGLGYEARDAVAAVAKDFPDQKLIIVDDVVDAPNVESFVFRHQEAGFLMGAYAAQMTQLEGIGMNPEKVIAIVEGIDVPTIHAFYDGYVAGAKWVDPDVEAILGEVGAWNDPTKGNELSVSLFNRGADIQYQVAGGSGLGVFQAAKTMGFFALGADVNQNLLDPDHIIGSGLKLTDKAVIMGVGAAVDGSFKGGTYSLGVKEGAMDITVEGTTIEIPDAVMEKVNEAKEKISSGEIVVPSTDEELEAFLATLQK